MSKIKIAVIIVINYYCKNDCSQRESNPQLALRRRLLYPFNYENKFQKIFIFIITFLDSKLPYDYKKISNVSQCF